MSHICRDPLSSPPENLALAEDAIRTNNIWFHLELFAEEDEIEAYAGIFVVCAFRPNIGESVVDQSGRVFVVTNVTYRVNQYDKGFQLVPRILARRQSSAAT